MAKWGDIDEEYYERIKRETLGVFDNDDFREVGTTRKAMEDRLYRGWFEDTDSSRRVRARERFFQDWEEMGYDIADFPWDEWREWYGDEEAAA